MRHIALHRSKLEPLRDDALSPGGRGFFLAEHFQHTRLRGRILTGKHRGDDVEALADIRCSVWLGDEAKRRILVGQRVRVLHAQEYRWNTPFTAL